MPRTTADQPIASAAARRRLPADGKLRWRGLRPGLAVGWSRRSHAAGTWVARLALPGGKQATTTIGVADDVPEVAGMTWSQAAERATEWARRRSGREVPGGDVITARTVLHALDAYATAKREAGQDRWASDIETLKRHHLATLGNAKLDTLNVPTLRAWRAGLPATLSRARRDGLAALVSAALRHAEMDADTVRRGLVPQGPREAVAARVSLLSEDQVAAFVRAAEGEGEDFALLVAVMAATGCRPSQLARCKRDDLDPVALTLTVPPSRKGRARGAQRQGTSVLPLSAALIARMLARPAGPDGLLLSRVEMVRRNDGRGHVRWMEGDGRMEWSKRFWVEPASRAAQCAGLPAGTSLYALRHAAIQRMLVAGVPPALVARALDTSIAIIEAHYGRHVGRRLEAVDILRRAMAPADQ